MKRFFLPKLFKYLVFLNAGAWKMFSNALPFTRYFLKRPLWIGCLKPRLAETIFRSGHFEEVLYIASLWKSIFQSGRFEKVIYSQAMPGLSKGIFQSDALKRWSIAKPFKTNCRSSGRFEKVIYSHAFPKGSLSKRALCKGYLRPSLSKSIFQSGRFEKVILCQALRKKFLFWKRAGHQKFIQLN